MVAIVCRVLEYGNSYNSKTQQVKATICTFSHSHILTLTSHLFHSEQLVAVELHDDFMQLCALSQGLDAGRFGVGVNLCYGLVPLLLCGSLGVAFVQHFEFENVAMLCGIVRKVGQEEEVAKAVVQL